jgi:Fe-S-cluster containining protein
MYDRKAFERYIQNGISKKSGLFKIAKQSDHACVFLNKEGKCSIHQFKPRTCDFFYCNNQKTSQEMPWTATCTSTTQKQKLWEQSVASQLTRKYIERNGTEWHEQDFNKSLLSIYDNIVTHENQKLKLARLPNNLPVGMIYTCENCSNKGTCATETLVTIPDMDRIRKKINASWKQLFRDKLDQRVSDISGIFRVYREKHCVFFDPETHCSLGDAQPMHCKFTPCPQKTQDRQLYDSFYLGAGTIDEQFRHQVAIAVTQEYVEEEGMNCVPGKLEEKLDKYEYYVNQKNGFNEFCKRIANYRYVDDTLVYKENS